MKTRTDSAQRLLSVLSDNLITDNLSEILQRITTDHVDQEGVIAAMSPPECPTPSLGYPTVRREVKSYHYRVVSVYWLFVAFTIGFFVALIAFVL